MSRESDLKRFLPDQYYENIEVAEKTLNFLMSQYPSSTRIDKAYVLGVVDKASERLIGHVGLSPVKSGIEVGYAIRDSHKNEGLATESVRLLLNIARKKFHLSQVFGIVNKKNIPSIKVLEKCGFILSQSNDNSLVYIATIL